MRLQPISLAIAASLAHGVFADGGDSLPTESMLVTGQLIADAPSTTRSNVPLIDTSKSIQIIDQNFIDEAGISSFEDALQYVSGTSPRLRLGGVDTQYYVRGFRESGTYRNGKRELFNRRVNMHTVETIDVLKGPASVQFGVNSPGGVVNYTTRKPQAEAQHTLKARVDEHGKSELIGDFTGAASESGNVLYRFIVAGEDSESFRDFSEQKSLTVAPSVTFLLSDRTQLTAAYELHETELPIDRGIPIGETSDGSYAIADVPVERKYSEPGDSSNDDTQLFDLTLAHQFNRVWQGEFSYSYQKWDSDWSDAQNEDFDITTGDMVRERFGYISKEQETHQFSALVHGDFDFAGINHKVTIGADYSESDLDAAWGENDEQPGTVFNLYNPVYGQAPTNLIYAYDETESTDTEGIFISETAYLGEKLVANLAGRYDSYDYQAADTDDWSYQEKDETLTWNAGLLYKVIPSTSVYMSYATSYEPNSAVDLVDELEPQEGKQWELGVKGSAMDHSLQYSLVFYDITKSNIPNDFEDDEGNDLVRLVGEQVSKGFELDTAWQISSDFSVRASYAYTDAEISKNEESPDEVGNAPEGVAENSAAVFVSYTLTELIPELTVVGGIKHADDVANRSDNRYNNFIVPGATTYDLGLKYRFSLGKNDSMLIQAGVKNLTDERVYIQQGSDSVGVGQVRTLYANLAYQF